MVRRLLSRIVGRHLIICTLLIMQGHAASAQSAICPVFAPAEERTGRGAVTAESLALLRDFGQGDNGSYQGPGFGVSPDGRRIALVVRRADTDGNRYCQALVIARRTGGARPRILPLGVQPLHQPFALRGLLTPNGVIAANQPRWSPDGRMIAILAPRDEAPQVLAISSLNGRARYLTKAPGGVIDFAWSQDGRALIYSTRAGLPAFRAAIDREALHGYHYDSRIAPLMSLRPQPPASLPISYRAVSTQTGRDSVATASERRLLDTKRTFPDAPGAVAIARGPRGSRAWIAPSDPSSLAPAMTLRADVGGREVTCGDLACFGHLTDLWSVGDAFLFLRREGWGSSMTALYQWRPGTAPVRLFSTEDLLAGCDLISNEIVCGREGSLQPRRLWSFNVTTGRQSIIFDPNPEFDRFKLPRVERLHWTGPLAIEGYGDLIVPASPPPFAGYPMVVVQYRTRGFARGAIGDEYPVLALAAHGFAVLSLENAPDYASVVHDPTITSPIAAERLDTTDDHNRRLQLGNLEQGVATAHAAATIDMKRLGISGVSDAASSAIYALIHTRLFAVASLGSPGLDVNIFALGGPALRKDFGESGFPMSGVSAERFDQSNALLPNAATIMTPLLLQYPADEYIAGVPTIAALEDANAPVEAYVFPEEHHEKSQPAHRLAIYRRNIAWFDFWLHGREGDAEATSAEVLRWRDIRAQLCARPRSEGVPTQLCSQASTSTN